MKDLLPFFRYLKGYRHVFIMAVIFGIIYGAISGFSIPVIFEKVFKKVFETEGSPLSLWQVVGIGSAIPIAFVLRGIFSFLSAYYMNFCGLMVMKGLKEAVFNRMQELPLSFFDKNKQGDLISRIGADPAMLQSIILEIATELFRQPVQILGALGGLAYLCHQNDSYVFLLFFAASVGMYIFPIKLLKMKLRQKGLAAQASIGLVYHHISENLDAVTEVRSFGIEDSQKSKFAERIDDCNNMELKITKYQKMQQPMIEVISAGVLGGVFIYAYYSGIPFSAFSAMGLALYFALDPLKRTAATISNFHRAQGSIIRVNELLNMPIDTPEPVDPVPVGRLEGEIIFKDVSFAYTDKELALVNTNANVPAGTSCALVGQSGAGKSTFAKLISRFYDVQKGAILIDGIDIRSMMLKDLRKNVGIVSQYPVLFNDTIYNNLLIGSPDATEAEVHAAAKAAYAHDFIMALPDGYDTLVGDRGDRLSGGQKQRIAIARAFLKNAPILVLDEATSALDSESEHFVHQALKELTKNKTVISIAHRLSTVKNADQIFVFDKGEIIGRGTHEGLYTNNKTYRSFVDKQSLLRGDTPQEKPAQPATV